MIVKRRLFIGLGSVAAVIIIAVATALLIHIVITNDESPTPSDQSTQVTTTPEALKTKAFEARDNGDIATAKDLFNQARAQYVDADDQQQIADIDAQLDLLNVPSSAPPTIKVDPETLPITDAS